MADVRRSGPGDEEAAPPHEDLLDLRTPVRLAQEMGRLLGVREVLLRALPKPPSRKINGRWWDGRSFRAETVHCVGGLFTRKRPAVPTGDIDLAGGFVVPPLGDAHCHHFDGERTIVERVKSYLSEGVFYAQNAGNSAASRRDLRVALRVNRPDSVDVTWADASLTSTLGHPFFVYEALANGLYNPGETGVAEKIKDKRKAEGDAYLFADTPEMLASVWQTVEKRRPDFLKVVLSNSQSHREKFARQVPGGHGLNPVLLPEVVARAHRSGLRVWLHVDTACDFHLGVRAGVDGFAHLPGYGMGAAAPEPYQLAEADVREAARRGVFVNVTTAIAKGYAPDPKDLERVQTVQRRNLRLLKKSGVKITIGMDSYGTGPWPEAEYLLGLGVHSLPELLSIWWTDTPRAIFPGRRIGALSDGFEASFLVLSKNPLERLDNLKEIGLRVKQGYLLP
jgi:imidazolonepropionase-like amidohydrolase